MKKVLLIEDDALLIRMYQKKLELDGFEVAVAVDGQKGVEMVKSEKPDLIILDIMLPEKDGFEVLREVKANDEVKHVPVLLLTNLGNSEEDVQKGIEMGAVDYLVKSNVVPSDVVKKIKEILDV